MCVIVISPSKNKRPTLETLKRCERSNRDGGGVAWIEDGKPTFRKGVDAEFIHDIMQTQSGPVVAHFRIATVGGVKPVLCHPFPITKNPSQKLQGQSDSVLFHNGTWPEWNSVLNSVLIESNLDRPQGEFSDSRASALVVSVAGRDALSHMGGKFCVLDNTGAYMYNSGWTKHSDGNWYSNMHWNWKPAYTKTYSSYKGVSLFDEACDVIDDDARFEDQFARYTRKTDKGLLSLGETLTKLNK
jgi:hypothetical protein